VGRSLRRRIDDIENCILQPIIPGSTKLDVSELPEPERKLFERALIIGENFDRIPDYVPSETSRKVMETTVERISLRVLDLFRSCFSGILSEGNKIADWMFTVRFYWFMHDITIMVKQFLEEQKIYDQKGKTWKQKEKEAHETVYKTWNHDLFTCESFTKFYRELTKAKEKHV